MAGLGLLARLFASDQTRIWSGRRLTCSVPTVTEWSARECSGSLMVDEAKQLRYTGPQPLDINSILIKYGFGCP